MTVNLNDGNLFSNFSEEESDCSPLNSNKYYDGINGSKGIIDSSPDEFFLELFEKAEDPTNYFELRDLYIGRVEALQVKNKLRPQLAEFWNSKKKLRSITQDEVLSLPSTVGLIKELFNTFFRDDLYGTLRSKNNVILSSGTCDETLYGLPPTLKECLAFSLDKGWYGYSDSLGRESCREAIARLETFNIKNHVYGLENVALSLGGTAAISSLAAFLSGCNYNKNLQALCVTPHYPPLLKAISQYYPIKLVPIHLIDGRYSLDNVLSNVSSNTSLIFLQTVVNPTGISIDEMELAKLIEGVDSKVMIILDECHDCLGEHKPVSKHRSASNVIRIKSLSKDFSVPGFKLGWVLGNEGLMKKFYEFASSNYGGPQSFFYLLIEIIARMERWKLENIVDLTRQHLLEFEEHYGLSLSNLDKAYKHYKFSRFKRHNLVRGCIGKVTSIMKQNHIDFINPTNSINLTITPNKWHDSYHAFRDILYSTSISIYPGILTFILKGDMCRISPVIDNKLLDQSLVKLSKYIVQKNN